jgi:uncharacterized protein (DUF58 family)
VPNSVALPVTPSVRGRFDELSAEIQLSGPFGIVRVRRSIELRLPRSVWIGPAPSEQIWTPDPMSIGDVSATSPKAALVGDAVRSTRPYRPGDPAHLVHWPSTARSGSLVVRELEPPAAVAVAVVVQLGGIEAADDAAVSRTAGLIEAVHRLGGQVILCTHDDGGSHATPVSSLIEANRLLATAAPGPPGSPPAGWSVLWVQP